MPHKRDVTQWFNTEYIVARGPCKRNFCWLHLWNSDRQSQRHRTEACKHVEARSMKTEMSIWEAQT